MKTYTVTIFNPRRTTQQIEVEALNERAAICKVLTQYVLSYSVLELPLDLTIQLVEEKE